MKISEVVFKLLELQIKRGDVEVLIAHEDGDGDFGRLDDDADAVIFVSKRYMPKDA